VAEQLTIGLARGRGYDLRLTFRNHLASVERVVTISPAEERAPDAWCLHADDGRAIQPPGALVACGSDVGAVGVLWGPQMWCAALSRSVALSGGQAIVWLGLGALPAIYRELLWVRTYENVLPGVLAYRDQAGWQYLGAGANGVVNVEGALWPSTSATVIIDLTRVAEERSRRPLLRDCLVPLG
jgi:hypothetical protein